MLLCVLLCNERNRAYSFFLVFFFFFYLALSEIYGSINWQEIYGKYIRRALLESAKKKKVLRAKKKKERRRVESEFPCKPRNQTNLFFPPCKPKNFTTNNRRLWMCKMGVPGTGGRVESERVIPKYRSEIILIKKRKQRFRGYRVFYPKPFAKSHSFGKNRPLFRLLHFMLCAIFSYIMICTVSSCFVIFISQYLVSISLIRPLHPIFFTCGTKVWRKYLANIYLANWNSWY